MKYKITKHGDLEISVDRQTKSELYAQYQEYLKNCAEGDYKNPSLNFDFESDSFMTDTLEPFIGNSEYEWISPSEIGALTDAPILGMRGEDETEISNLFWYPNYMVASPQRDLAQQGYTIFQKAE